MTTEEAIQHLQEAREYPVAYTPEEQEAYEMAFSALCAQQAPLDRSRWEGCSDCTGYMNKSTCWNFQHCPTCGRPRTEQAWEDLERRLKNA